VKNDKEIIMIIKYRLSPLALALALGILWGLAIFLIGLISSYYPHGKAFLTSLLGFNPTVWDSLIGGLIGFVDAFIFGAILAWLYNLFAKCCGNREEIVDVKKEVRHVNIE
jgi:hypothetical protein